MSVKQASRWLTACLFYSEPFEEFLVKGVKPYVDVVMQAGIAEYYYFERCWDKGPHIKLWFKGNAEVMETMLKPNLEEHFRTYFESKPSFRKSPSYPVDFPENLKWHPNNSILYLENIQRGYDFGGEVVYFIAQKQFKAASDIVLQSIKNKKGRWTYDDAISSAIKLHLSFAFATGMDLMEMSHFFEICWNSWKPDSSQNSFLLKNPPQKNILQSSFREAYSIQENDLVAFTSALWDALEYDRNNGDEGYEDWIHRNINVNIELGLVQEVDKLGEKMVGYYFDKNGLPAEIAPLWDLYAEFVHLTNNRLGLRGKDEGYLFYVLSSSLKSVLRKSSKEAMPFIKEFAR